MEKDVIQEKIKEFAKLKEEDEKTYQDTLADINESIEIINGFDDSNYEDLLIDTIDTRRHLKAIKKNIKSMRENMDDLFNKKEEYDSIQEFNLNEFFDNEFEKIIAIYLISSLTISSTANNILDFIRKYLIVSLIGLVSFKANSKYFASNLRKQQLLRKKTEIDFDIELNKYNINALTKYYYLFERQLNCENKKIKEIMPKRLPGESQESYAKRLNPISVLTYIKMSGEKPLTKKRKNKLKK